MQVRYAGAVRSLPPLSSSLLCAAIAVSPARAGGLGAHTSRDALPAREVERTLLVPRGWTLASLSYSARDLPEAPGASSVQTLRAEVAHGLLPRVDVRAALPLHEVRGRFGARRAGIGDGSLACRLALLERDPPLTALAVELGVGTPSGRGGAQPVALGSGTPDLSAGLAARRRLGALALSASVGGILRLPGRVAYVPGSVGDHGVVDPSDELVARLDALLQAGPLLGGISSLHGARGAYTVEERVKPWAGWSWSIEARGGVQPTRGITVELYGTWPQLAPSGPALPYVPQDPGLAPVAGGLLRVAL